MLTFIMSKDGLNDMECCRLQFTYNDELWNSIGGCSLSKLASSRVYPDINSSGVYICKSEENDLKHGNYIYKSEGIHLTWGYCETNQCAHSIHQMLQHTPKSEPIDVEQS